MTDQLNQQVSAFVDNELPEEECTLFIRRLCTDDELQSAVNRFALIGDAMRGELLAADVQLSQHVRAAIAGDAAGAAETSSDSAPRGRSRWMRPVSGLAVAATVAAVAVLSLQGFDTPDNSELPSSTVAEIGSDENGALRPVTVLPRPNLPEVRPASVMSRTVMDQYLLRHRGYVNSFGRQSVMGIRDIGTHRLTPVPPAEDTAVDPANAEDRPE